MTAANTMRLSVRLRPGGDELWQSAVTEHSPDELDGLKGDEKNCMKLRLVFCDFVSESTPLDDAMLIVFPVF